ncbi:MAG: hypothetical protein HQ567_00105 [Candidatus Nealsonbacteria bacterium]|nr:hypothetical protein [Candidatus Nealsonbacteria bacterium]
MWLGQIAGLLTMVATVSPSGANPSSAAAESQPIITRQTQFTIPFRIDEPRPGEPRPVEVQLYVSSDWGATWRFQAKADPATRQFVFNAPNDAEYWFAVRTLDASGQLQPRQPGPPGLRVVVDTLIPALQLEAERGPAGEVVARWRITEPHLKLDSLQISYGPSAGGPWRAVAVNRPGTTTAGNVLAGDVTWWPAAGTEEIHVRAEVCDMAGHPARSHARVRPKQDTAFRPPNRTDRQPPQVAGNDAPVWRPGSTEPSRTWPSDRQSSRPLAGDQGAAATPDTPWSGPQDGHYGDQQQYGGPASDPPSGTTANKYYPPIGSQYVPPGSDATGLSGTGPSGTAPAGTGNYGTGVSDTGNYGTGVSDTGNYGTGASNTGNYGAEQRPLAADASAGQDRGAGERPRMVNSQSFELIYDVDRSTAWEAGPVTVWGTCDGGQTWQKAATDDDNYSPVVVRVDQEGTYGYRMTRAAGGAAGGTADRAPQSGELPEVLVGVDWTKPTARITSARQGYGPQADRLVVTWQAEDRTLAARPVTLSFGTGTAGPWTTLAAGLENTGNYTWRVDRRVPERVYLRLDVKDEAGNTESFVTSQMVSLQWPRPKVNIRDVRPMDRTGQAAAKRYFF